MKKVKLEEVKKEVKEEKEVKEKPKQTRKTKVTLAVDAEGNEVKAQNDAKIQKEPKKQDIKVEAKPIIAKKETGKKPTQNASEANKNKSQKNKSDTKSKVIETVGKKSSELESLDNAVKTKEEEEYSLFKELLVHQKTRQILWGEVYGVEPNEALGKNVVAVLWNGIKVSIPDTEYFEKNFDFGIRYKEADEKERANRRRITASYQCGARVCFLVKGVIKYTIKDGEHKGEEEIFCVGSRKEAMTLLRDVYFFHKERKNPLNAGSTVKVDDVCDAHVVAVKPDNVLVECLGVETRILWRDLAEGYVENCQDVVNVGDTIRVRIKKFYLNGNDNVYLAVTGKLNDVSKMISSMQIKATYIGVVESINKDKKIYNVRLKNGVLAAILQENVRGGIELFIGNWVAVKVSKINDTFVYGSAMKIHKKI